MQCLNRTLLNPWSFDHSIFWITLHRIRFVPDTDRCRFFCKLKAVGFNVTIPVLFPVADQGMIFMPRVHCSAAWVVCNLFWTALCNECSTVQFLGEPVGRMDSMQIVSIFGVFQCFCREIIRDFYLKRDTPVQCDLGKPLEPGDPSRNMTRPTRWPMMRLIRCSLWQHSLLLPSIFKTGASLL